MTFLICWSSKFLGRKARGLAQFPEGDVLTRYGWLFDQCARAFVLLGAVAEYVKDVYMGVSINGGIPIWMVYKGTSH